MEVTRRLPCSTSSSTAVKPQNTIALKCMRIYHCSQSYLKFSVKKKRTQLLTDISPLQQFWHSTSPYRIHGHRNRGVQLECSAWNQTKRANKKAMENEISMSSAGQNQLTYYINQSLSDKFKVLLNWSKILTINEKSNRTCKAIHIMLALRVLRLFL